MTFVLNNLEVILDLLTETGISYALSSRISQVYVVCVFDIYGVNCVPFVM